MRRAEACSADLSALLELDDESLSGIFHTAGGRHSDSRGTVFEQKVDDWIKELRGVGVTRELLWQEYRAEHPGGYSYSQFCEHLGRHVGQRDLTLALDHKPGEVLMVDFAGKKVERRYAPPVAAQPCPTFNAPGTEISSPNNLPRWPTAPTSHAPKTSSSQAPPVAENPFSPAHSDTKPVPQATEPSTSTSIV